MHWHWLVQVESALPQMKSLLLETRELEIKRAGKRLCGGLSAVYRLLVRIQYEVDWTHFFFSHCRASLCTGLGYRIALYPSLYAGVHCRADTPYCAVVCLFSLQTLRDFSEKRLPYASHLMSFCSLHKGFQALLIDESQHVLAHSAIVLRTHARSQQLLGRKSFDLAIVCSYVYLVNKNKPWTAIDHVVLWFYSSIWTSGFII